MTRLIGVLFAAAIVAGAAIAPGRASAQVVIQAQGSAQVYGQGQVYGQAQASPYVATAPAQPRVQTIVHRSPTMTFLVPGIIALGGGWLVHGLGSLGISAQCTVGTTCPRPIDQWVGLGWVPLAGPWLAYGLSSYVGGYDWFNIVFGLVQAAGAVFTVLGLVIQQEWEEQIYVDLGDQPGAPRLELAAGIGSVGGTLTF
jgi:hypothetical protein